MRSSISNRAAPINLNADQEECFALVKNGDIKQIEARLKARYSNWLPSFVMNAAASLNLNQDDSVMLFMEAAVKFGKIRVLHMLFKLVSAKTYYAQKTFSMLIDCSNQPIYTYDYLLFSRLTQHLLKLGVNLVYFEDAIANAGNQYLAKMLMNAKGIDDPLHDNNFIKAVINHQNWQLLTRIMSPGIATPERLIWIFEVVSQMYQHDPLHACEVGQPCFDSLKRNITAFSTLQLTQIILKFVKLAKLQSEDLSDLEHKSLDKCSDAELYQIKTWLQNIELQNSSELVLLEALHNVIKALYTFIKEKFKNAITYEYLHSLVESYDRHKNDRKSILQALFVVNNEDINKLRTLLKRYGHRSGTLEDKHLNEIYELLKNRKVKIEVKNDYFHQPHEIANQIFFRLSWMLGRIEGFEINEMLPPYLTGIDDWWEHVGYKPHHSHLYEISYEDLYIDEMQADDKSPAIYNIRDIREEYKQKSIITRDKSEIPRRHFTNSQIQTLFRERPDVVEYCKSLHAEAVKSMARIRNTTVNELERIGEHIFQYSSHRTEIRENVVSSVVFQVTFSVTEANRRVGELLGFLENLPAEERYAIENISHNDTTLKDVIKSILNYGCTGQVGEYVRTLVRKIRESQFVVDSNEPLKSSYSVHLDLIDPKATRHTVHL